MKGIEMSPDGNGISHNVKPNVGFQGQTHGKTRNDVGRDDSEPRMHTNGHEWAKGGEGI